MTDDAHCQAELGEDPGLPPAGWHCLWLSRWQLPHGQLPPTGRRDKGTATLENSGRGRVQRVAEGGGRRGRRCPGLHSGKEGKQATGIRERERIACCGSDIAPAGSVCRMRWCGEGTKPHPPGLPSGLSLSFHNQQGHSG